jgi:tRNA A37 threonylcarbamoyladenosine synthetase subunit TsaC/SUA5/YrdC
VLWLDGGQAPGGLPSTVVVESSQGTLRIARQGAVARATIEQVVGAHVLEG